MSSDTTMEQSSRDRVLLAAQELIIEHGNVDFSMRELAEMSGLAKATLYHHFPDKETICRSVIEIELATLSRRIHQAAASSDDPLKQITAIVEVLFGPEIERKIMLLVNTREVPGLGVGLKDVVTKYRFDLARPILQVIQNGIDKGVFRPLDPELTVLSLMGMMQSFVTHRLIAEPDQHFHNVVEHTLDMLLNGIIDRQ